MGTTEAGIDTNITPDLTLDKETTTDDTSNLRLDGDKLKGGTKTDDKAKPTMNTVEEDIKADKTLDITFDIGKKSGVTSILDTGTESEVTLNITSGVATVEEDVEREEISDSQLYAITAMDWTEEPLGPAGDSKQSHQSETRVLPPSIPDGTAIVQGLIRELSNLNMMLLRAKREMQTANQRIPPTRTSNNRVNMRTEK